MFRGFVNIWNYFSENVTALRMRDNCWGVTQRNEAMAYQDAMAKEEMLVVYERVKG